jgi:DivIVA domain-containing protein
MAEGRAPISSSRIATGDIARHSFALVRRGFDTDEVRAYLQSVARSLETLEENEQELRAALADAEERAAHPVVDEATLTASLGQHSAQILRHAHEEAARIVAQAQEGAATLLRDTQSQVDELQARSEASTAERVVEVELLVANAEQEARVESERLLSDAISEGEAVIAQAKDEGRALLEQVQEARRRVLADLAGRRRTLGMQIEALRAARDEMTASVQGVRDRVDGILTQLDRTDEKARAAAMAVSDQFRLQGPPDGPHDEEALESAVGAAMDGVMGEAPPTGPTPATGPAGEGTGSAGEEGTPGAAPSVDELFARIRAGSDDDKATAEPPPPASAAADAPTAAVELTKDAEVADVAAVAADAAAEDGATESESESEATPGPDDDIISRRDEVLGPITARLSRTIKRTLGDDQNRLLDKLRSKPSLLTDDLLGDEGEHVETFAAASRNQLARAFAAGATFGGAGSAVPQNDAVEQASGSLAQVIVTMLRRQIAEGGGDPVDRVGAAYREWRGERVERLSGDFATQAFSAGVMAVGADGKVRWIVTNASGCSDCADNALAGAVSVDEVFPTGHLHPPAHSGCRCLVPPTDG